MMCHQVNQSSLIMANFLFNIGLSNNFWPVALLCAFARTSADLLTVALIGTNIRVRVIRLLDNPCKNFVSKRAIILLGLNMLIELVWNVN